MNNCIKNLISAGWEMSIQYRRLIMHGKSQRRQEMDLNQSTWILILYSRTEHDATLSFSLPPLTFLLVVFARNWGIANCKYIASIFALWSGKTIRAHQWSAPWLGLGVTRSRNNPMLRWSEESWADTCDTAHVTSHFLVIRDSKGISELPLIQLIL